MNYAHTRVGAYCIRPEMPLDDGLGLKPDGFLVYPDGEMWNPPGFSCTRVGAQKHTPLK